MQRELALCELGVSTAAGAAAAAAEPSASAAAWPGSPERTQIGTRPPSCCNQLFVVQSGKTGCSYSNQACKAILPAKLGCGDASPSANAASACAGSAGARLSLIVGNVTLRRARSIFNRLRLPTQRRNEYANTSLELYGRNTAEPAGL